MNKPVKILIRILVILLLYFLSQAVVLTAFAAIGGMGAEGDIQGAMEAYLAEKAALTSIVHNGLIILCVLIYRRRNGDIRNAMSLAKLPSAELGMCAAAGICSAFFVITLLSLLPLPESTMAQYGSAVSQSTAGTFIEQMLCVVLFAPVAEELLFRGAIYGSFKSSAKPIVAIAASCAIFGIMHQDPVWMVYAFLMGLCLTLTLEAYSSLIAPIVLHVAFNLTGTLLPRVMGNVPIAIFCTVSAACLCFIVYFAKHAKGFSAARTTSDSEDK